MLRGLGLVLLCAISLCAGGQPAQRVMHIGRIASRAAVTKEPGTPVMARYLESKIPGYAVQFDTFAGPLELISAVERQEIDFAQVSSSLSVELEVRYGATPIATVVTLARPGVEVQALGGAVFCRAEENSIQQLVDLRGKRLAAVHPYSLAGVLAVRRELQALGIRPEKDLKEIRYLGTVEKVIDAVVRSETECGCVGSNSLDVNLHEGYVERSRIRILPPPRPYPDTQGYPLPLSTRLYPATPFIKMRQTPLALANKVATALLAIEPGSELARSMGVGGWSVPMTYQPVHECLQELGVAPYEKFGKVTITEAMRQHWSKILLVLIVIILGLAAEAGRVSLLNRRLRASQSALEAELAQRGRVEEERKKLEEQLRQSQKLESVGRLAGGVAHDFNNLLTVINGYSDLVLMRLGENEPLRERITQIREAGERAASLTQQLLAFSRKQIVQPRSLNLNAVVAETEKLLRRVVGEDIEIVTMLDPALGHVIADPGQFHQVLMNLAINSRDAMPGGGKLILETANVELDESAVAGRAEMNPGSYVLLAVSDTGVGLDEEVRRHLFEPFFTTKARGKGTGLGLSMVYGIVKQSGGWIWVYSEKNKGTTFKIYLPRTDMTLPPGEGVPAAAAECRGTETVLVVEDQEEVRRLAREALEAYGYRVLEAANGVDALALAGRHAGPIHALLTDVVMPGMTATELAERMKTPRPGTKVLYMSGYTENVIVHKGMLNPGIAYIAKPFTPEGLAAKVREVLGLAAGGWET